MATRSVGRALPLTAGRTDVCSSGKVSRTEPCYAEFINSIGDSVHGHEKESLVIIEASWTMLSLIKSDGVCG